MIVISNASPLLALSQIQCLPILKTLFGRIYVPDSVHMETVVKCHIPIQKQGILKALGDFIDVVTPAVTRKFSRHLGKGERGVLDLAIEKQADILLMDDKKARNEAKELGFMPAFTTDILKHAARQKLIVSYTDAMLELRRFGIYLPQQV